MSLKYNQINIEINNSALIADSIEINDTSTQKAISNFNNRNPFDYVPTNYQGYLNISYYLEPKIDPFYPIITGLIYDTTNPIPAVINFGNIYTTGYLNSFTFQLLPNSMIKIRASLDTFNPLTGLFIEQPNTGDANLYNILNSSGMAHYWSAHFYSGASLVSDSNVLQLEYSVNINQTPIYSLGKPYPTQIYVNSINENLNILSESELNTQYSGQKIDNILPSLQMLKINNISKEWSNDFDYSITIPLTGMILNQTKESVQIDDVMFFSLLFNKYH